MLFFKKRFVGLDFFACYCASILLLVWPLSGTIAARNLALALGLLFSLLWLAKNFYKIQNPYGWLPFLLLICVPMWALLQYIYFPTNRVEQGYDLGGTWLRVFAGIFYAFILGKIISRDPRKILFIWVPLSIWIFITLGFYFYEFMVSNVEAGWFISGFRGTFKYKSALVYFLMWPYLLGYGFLHASFTLKNKNFRYKKTMLIAGYILVIGGLLNFCIAYSLAGLLVGLIVGLGFLFVLLLNIFKHRCGQNLMMAVLPIAVFLTGVLVAAIYFDSSYENRLTNLIGDVRVAAQIDSHEAWKRLPDYDGELAPKDSSGRQINISTSDRISWLVKGIDLLLKNPLGAGFSNLPFRYFMLKEFPSSEVTKTHSGWLDFALGFGFLGIFFVFFAIYASFNFCLMPSADHRITVLRLSGLWMLAGIFILWFPAELSEREFIESLFFMIALIGSYSANTRFYPD